MEKTFRVEGLPEFDNHTMVSFFYDRPSGLRAVVAIHSDALGPATGGTRMWPYRTEIEAVRDVLNLSRAMTYKCALAGISYGGGKAVIIGSPNGGKTPELLRAYAELTANYFGGKFRTGTDVGLTDDDVRYMSKFNKYLVGVVKGEKLSTSKVSSLGVFLSIKGCFEEMYMKSEIAGKRFAVKGLGKTGLELVRLLSLEGADIIAADINAEKAALAKQQFPGIKIVSPATIHLQRADVYCPCALGGDLNPRSVRELRCRFVVGAANNQLSSIEVGDELFRRGIIYAPDYIANAGGVINVVDELEPSGYEKQRVLTRIKAIKGTVRKIVSRSQKEKQPTARIADKMAEEILRKKGVRRVRS